jgi:hypothetical protein
MNKLLCIPALFVLMTATPVNADYRMVVGLEQNSGGGLANDSIVFKNGITPPDGNTPTNDYSMFGSYETVARSIVNNPNPNVKVTYDDVKEIFNAGYDLNEYKKLQDFGYGLGLLEAFVFGTSLHLNNLIELHNEGYQLDRLGQAAYYLQNIYDMPFDAGIAKITTSYKASCWNTLDEAFMLIDISEWDNYASQQNCLK